MHASFDTRISTRMRRPVPAGIHVYISPCSLFAFVCIRSDVGMDASGCRACAGVGGDLGALCVSSGASVVRGKVAHPANVAQAFWDPLRGATFARLRRRNKKYKKCICATCKRYIVRIALV